MLTRKTIDEIFDVVQIEDVVGDFVELKRRGVNLLGLCPFHHEKTPSFTVSPGKNIYKCFGCGEAGNAVNFLMTHENLSYPEALKWIAGKYNLVIEESEPSPEQKAQFEKKDSLQIVNDMAQQFFAEQLMNSDEGKSVGLSYFKQRGLREETIKKFGLGYAPSKGNMLSVKSMHDGYKQEYLKELGLLNQYGGDFFKGRVMFTIHGLSGKILGFAGRILSSVDNAPKYINSPETEIYSKGKILYGFYQAKNAIRRQDECLLTEGYMDVITLAQAGIENVVAASGTALTIDQVRLVKRFTQNITLLFDGDPAGIKAALRGLDIVLHQDMNVRVVLLPNGEDPDSYLQQVGTEAFMEFVKTNADDFIRFKTKHLLKETANDPIRRVEVADDIAATIAGLPDPMKQNVYIRETAASLDISESAFITSVNKHKIQLLTKEKKALKQADSLQKRAIPKEEEHAFSRDSGTRYEDKLETLRDQFQEQYMAGLLIMFGTQQMEDGAKLGDFLLENLEDTMEFFEHPLYKEVIAETRAYKAEHGECPAPAHYVNHQNEAIRLLAANLSAQQYELSPNWEERYSKALHQKMPDLNFIKDCLDALNRFKLKKLQHLIHENQKKMKDSQDAEALEMMLQIHMHLKEIEQRIAAKTGTIVVPKFR